MKHIIHIHQQKIRQGFAAIIDRTYKGSTHHRRIEVICPCGCEHVAAVIVQPGHADSCGARVWIEAQQTRHEEVTK